MNYVLGYDCDGAEIDEYRILRAIWSNDIEIEDLDADPRQYCAVVGDDGIAYAISVYDWWNRDLIRKKENINEDEKIPIIVKPIKEMENYEVAYCCTGEFYYSFSREELKTKFEFKKSTKLDNLYELSDEIEVRVLDYDDANIEMYDGYPVWKLELQLDWFKEQKRDKDKEKIEIIEDFLEKKKVKVWKKDLR